MWNKTRATKLLGIKYPIIQGPFGGNFSSTKLVSTVSNSGGMGSFGLNSYSPEGILEIDAEIKSLTNKPYALNLWIPLKEDPVHGYRQEDFEALKKLFKPYFEEFRIPLPEVPDAKTQDFEVQVESVLKAKPPVASFIYGIPSKEIIHELKTREIAIIATATTVEEAVLVEEAGVDLVVASGAEAGGHRASFIRSAEESLTDTRSLISEVVDNVKLPVIAAGGISSSKDIVNVLRQGASAVQIGTAFLATDESNASAIHKSKLLSKEPLKTELTRVYTGRLARVLSNKLTRDFNKSNMETFAPYPIQSAFLSSLKLASFEQNNFDYVAFYSGQPSEILQHNVASELFKDLIDGVSVIYSGK